MTRTCLLVFSLLSPLGACIDITDTKALQTCDVEDESVDCCSTADECTTYFGSEFPYCSTPGDTTGRCVECTTDSHCDQDAFCLLDSPFGPYCAPED